MYLQSDEPTGRSRPDAAAPGVRARRDELRARAARGVPGSHRHPGHERRHAHALRRQAGLGCDRGGELKRARV